MQNSLRFRLIIILVVLAIVPLLVVGSIIAQRSFVFEQQQAYDLQNQVAGNVATELESVFLGINNDLDQLGNEIRGLENPDQAQQLSLMLSAISSGTYSDYYDELTLLNKNGLELVRLSPEAIVPNADLTDESNTVEFKQAVATRAIYYGPVVKDFGTGKATITIAIPLFQSRSTNLNNVLIAKIRLDVLGNDIGRVPVGENQTIYLTDTSGHVLAHQDRTKNLGSLIIHRPNSATTQTGLDGTNVIMAPARIPLGDRSLYVVAEKPVAVALDLAYTTINTIVIVIILALMAAALLSYLAVRQIVVPVEGLAAVAEKVASGDLSQKANITSRDEIGTLATTFNSMTTQLSGLVGSLEQRVEERTAELEESTKQIQKRASQLEAIANIARSVATVHDLGELLTLITREINSRFGFYHAGVFLLDENREYAILAAANSEGGLRMLRRGHRLRVGEQGIVGHATMSGEPSLALDVGENAIYFNNPDLPETHSEVALPLKFGQEIIGALDIQSKESNAFSQEDLEIFSILADQVSVAIQNARSLEQAERALKEAEIASSQLTGQAWKGYTERMRIRGYRYDGFRSESLREASNSGDDQDAFSIPVVLRGQAVGRLKLRSSEASRKWTEDELAVIKSTADRVALAIDSARLLDEAQKRAARETFLSELAGKLGTSFRLDSILRDTVEELGQQFKGATVSFQLINPSAPPTAEDMDDNSTPGKASA